SDNETGLEVERRIGSSTAWTRVLTTGANVSTIDDVGLAGSTTYHYRLRSVNVAGVSAYTPEVTVTTQAGSSSAGPDAPSHLAIRSVTAGKISVMWWDMSNNETGFEVERRTSSGTFARIATKGANVSTHDDTTVTSGLLYVYRVRSVNGSGASAWSNEISATAP